MRVRPRFQIQLSDGDTELLHNLQKHYGLGSVKTYPPRKQGHNGTATWIVQSKPDIQKLIDILDKSVWHSKKYLDYIKWKKVVDMTNSSAYMDINSFEVVIDIFSTMNGGKKSTRKNWKEVIQYEKNKENKTNQKGKADSNHNS